MASLLSRVVLGTGLAAAVAIGGPTIAGAQPAAPSDADKQAAKQLTKEGIDAMNAGENDKAVDLYKKAYARSPHPVLLANIALAHRRAGHGDEALTYYERYLAADPDGSEAGPSRVAITQLKAAGAVSKPDLDRAPAATEPPPTAVTSTPPIRALEPEPASRTDPVGRPGRSLRITGLVLGGVGIATLATGGYFGLRVLQLESDAKDAAAAGIMQQELQDMYEADGDAAERNQLICFGVGGALLIGGAVTYWLGARQGRSAPTTAWMPVVGTNFAGFALTGSLR